MYISADDIKNEISLYYPIANRNGNKKVGLIRTYFGYSLYNVEKDEKIHLKNGKTLPVNPIRPGAGSEAWMTKLTADNQKPLTL